jgi:hypothetical protein
LELLKSGVQARRWVGHAGLVTHTHIGYFVNCGKWILHSRTLENIPDFEEDPTPQKSAPPLVAAAAMRALLEEELNKSPK